MTLMGSSVFESRFLASTDGGKAVQKQVKSSQSALGGINKQWKKLAEVVIGASEEFNRN